MAHVYFCVCNIPRSSALMQDHGNYKTPEPCFEFCKVTFSGTLPLITRSSLWIRACYGRESCPLWVATLSFVPVNKLIYILTNSVINWPSKYSMTIDVCKSIEVYMIISGLYENPNIIIFMHLSNIGHKNMYIKSMELSQQRRS